MLKETKMADEDKTMVEVEETDTAAKAKGKSPLMKYGMYAGIVIVMVLAAYFVTLKVVKPMLAGGDAETEQVDDKAGHETANHDEEAKEDSHASSEDSHASKGSHESGEKSSGVEAGDIFMMDNIIVNPAGTGGTRFLSASIGFELESARAGDIMSAREAVVRDALITILSSQSIPELTDFKQRERLRKLIKLRVAKLLKTEDIGAVYFTEFVLQ